MTELQHLDIIEFETQGIVKVGSVIHKGIKNKKVKTYTVTTDGYDRIKICAKTLICIDEEVETRETMSYIQCSDCNSKNAFRNYCPIAKLYNENISVDLCNSCYSKRSYGLN